jgi:hypothetical protein
VQIQRVVESYDLPAQAPKVSLVSRLERGKIVAILILLNLATLLIISVPSLDANSKADSYQCISSHAIVCVNPDFPPGRVTLATKFGQLVPLREMAFLKFILFAANGSMFFDVTNLVPTPDIALQFTTQSFGNGTLDIVFKGPSAFGVTADGASQVLTSAHGSWGDGVEIIYANPVFAGLLVINYLGTGPGPCWPYCNPAVSQFVKGLTIVGLLAIVSGFSLLALKLADRRTRKLEEANSRVATKV